MLGEQHALQEATLATIPDRSSTVCVCWQAPCGTIWGNYFGTGQRPRLVPLFTPGTTDSVSAHKLQDGSDCIHYGRQWHLRDRHPRVPRSKAGVRMEQHYRYVQESAENYRPGPSHQVYRSRFYARCQKSRKGNERCLWPCHSFVLLLVRP